MQPGDEREEPDPSLPAATTVATLIDRRLSIAGLYGSLSHGALKSDPPRLMLTATTLSDEATEYTCSSPAMMSDESAPAHGPAPPHVTLSMISVKTWTARRFAPLPTPENV